MVARGVRGQAIPASQADRLLARQLRQVPRWLQQTRYNGPPPLKLPRGSIATASNYSNNAAFAGDGVASRLRGLRGEAGGRQDARRDRRRRARRARRARAPSGCRPTAGRARPTTRRSRATVATSRSRPPPATSTSPSATARCASACATSAPAARRGVTGRLARAVLGLQPVDLGRRAACRVRDLGARRARRARRLGRRPADRALAGDPAPIGVTSDLYEPALSADGRVPGVHRRDAALAFPARPGARRDGASSPTATRGSPVVSARRDARRVHARAPGWSSRTWRPAPSTSSPRWPRAMSASEPSLSADGSRVAFTARGASELDTGVYVHDLRTGTTTLVSRGSGVSGPPAFGALVASVDLRRRHAGRVHLGRVQPVAAQVQPGARDLRARPDDRDHDARLAGDGLNRGIGPTKGSGGESAMRIALLCASGRCSSLHAELVERALKLGGVAVGAEGARALQLVGAVAA